MYLPIASLFYTTSNVMRAFTIQRQGIKSQYRAKCVCNNDEKHKNSSRGPYWSSLISIRAPIATFRSLIVECARTSAIFLKMARKRSWRASAFFLSKRWPLVAAASFCLSDCSALATKNNKRQVSIPNAKHWKGKTMKEQRPNFQTENSLIH